MTTAAREIPRDPVLDVHAASPLRATRADQKLDDAATRQAIATAERLLHTLGNLSFSQRQGDGRAGGLEDFVAGELRKPEVQTLLNRTDEIRNPGHPGVSSHKRLQELTALVARSSEKVLAALPPEFAARRNEFDYYGNGHMS